MVRTQHRRDRAGFDLPVLCVAAAADSADF